MMTANPVPNHRASLDAAVTFGLFLGRHRRRSGKPNVEPWCNAPTGVFGS